MIPARHAGDAYESLRRVRPARADSVQQVGWRRVELRRRLVRLSFGSALLFVLAMPLYLHHPAVETELSFPAALHQTAAEGVSSGSEVVYTFGPLGFLAFPQLYFPTTSLAAMVFGLGVGLAATFVTAWSLSRVMPPVLAAAATYVMLLIGWDRGA